MALTVSAGQIILADDHNNLVPIRVEKSASTSRNTTTTDTADPHLVLALAANRSYDIRGTLRVTSAADGAGDFKYSFSFPAGATVTVNGFGPHDSIASGSQGDGQWGVQAQDSTSPTPSAGYAASTSRMGIAVDTTVVMGATAGNVTLLWSQNSSNASNTTLEAGSYITAYPTG